MSDSDFDDFPCVTCGKESIGKSMWPCGECRGKVGQCCDMHYIGCASDDYAQVCQACFANVHHSRPQYCKESYCKGCSNKSPQWKAKRRAASDRFDRFRQSLDVAAWKLSHPPINYQSVHKGQYLIDLFFSDDSFKHGYVDWLIAAGEKPQANQEQTNFRQVVQEAKELRALADNYQ